MVFLVKYMSTDQGLKAYYAVSQLLCSYWSGQVAHCYSGSRKKGERERKKICYGRREKVKRLFVPGSVSVSKIKRQWCKVIPKRVPNIFN